MVGSDEGDFAAHEQTYATFLSLVKWGTGSVVLILVLMALFLLRH